MYRVRQKWLACYHTKVHSVWPSVILFFLLLQRRDLHCHHILLGEALLSEKVESSPHIQPPTWALGQLQMVVHLHFSVEGVSCWMTVDTGFTGFASFTQQKHPSLHSLETSLTKCSTVLQVRQESGCSVYCYGIRLSEVTQDQWTWGLCWHVLRELPHCIASAPPVPMCKTTRERCRAAPRTDKVLYVAQRSISYVGLEAFVWKGRECIEEIEIKLKTSRSPSWSLPVMIHTHWSQKVFLGNGLL